MDNAEIVDWLSELFKKIKKIDQLSKRISCLEDARHSHEYDLERLKLFRSSTLEAAMEERITLTNASEN